MIPALASFGVWVVEKLLGLFFKPKQPAQEAVDVQEKMAQDAVDRTDPAAVSGKLRDHSF